MSSAINIARHTHKIRTNNNIPHELQTNLLPTAGAHRVVKKSAARQSGIERFLNMINPIILFNRVVDLNKPSAVSQVNFDNINNNNRIDTFYGAAIYIVITAGIGVLNIFYGNIPTAAYLLLLAFGALAITLFFAFQIPPTPVPPPTS